MHPRTSPIELDLAGTSTLVSGRPFVAPFRGAAEALAALGAASSRRIPVRLWRPAALCGIANHDHETRGWAELGEVIEHIQTREHMFEDGDEDVSVFGLVHELVPELLEHLHPPVELPSPHCAHLWIGGRGQTTSLHDDPWPNCNFQLLGKKRFIVFPPEQAPYLRPCAADSGRRGEYEYDATSDSADPRFALDRIHGFSRTVLAGQMLFIPPGWPHQVVYESSLAVNVSFWGGEDSSHSETPSSNQR